MGDRLEAEIRALRAGRVDLVEVRLGIGLDLDRHAAEVRRLMIAGMAEVVPDVRIDVEFVAATAWSKEAGIVRDAAGRLLAWSPPTEAACAATTA